MATPTPKIQRSAWVLSLPCSTSPLLFSSAGPGLRLLQLPLCPHGCTLLCCPCAPTLHLLHWLWPWLLLLHLGSAVQGMQLVGDMERDLRTLSIIAKVRGRNAKGHILLK